MNLTGESYACLIQEIKVENRKYLFAMLTVMSLWLFLVLIAPLPYICAAVDETNPYQAEVTITKQDLIKAQPKEPEVVFTPQIEKEVSIMEKRHFHNKVTNETDSYRIARLESELMGRVWSFSPLETRMRRLKLASQRTMLAGTSLPNNLARIYSPKRIRNDSIELREREQVGIIDGLLRLYAPDFYQKLKYRNDRQFEYFGWE